MNLDLSGVPESTRLAIARLVQLADEGATTTVRVEMHRGGVAGMEERLSRDADDLRELAVAESENGRS